MRGTTERAAALALVLFSAACFDTTSGDTSFDNTYDTSEYQLAVPSVEDVELRMPADPAPSALRVGETAQYYQETYDSTRNVNGTIYGILSIVRDVVATEPSQHTEDMAVWGPYTPALEPTTFLLMVQRIGENHYQYAIMLRPRTSTSDDDYQAVLTGEAWPRAGSDDDRGRGRFMLDWTALAALNPNTDLQGNMHINYEAAELQWRTVEMLFEDFQDRNDAEAPTTLLYRYLESADTSGDFQFAYLRNIHDDPAKPLEELVQTRSRWVAAGMGRSDVRVSSPEIAADLATIGVDQDYVTVGECWDNGFLRTWYDESPVRLTEDDGEPESGWDGPGQGDAANCPFSDSLFVDDDVVALADE